MAGSGRGGIGGEGGGARRGSGLGGWPPFPSLPIPPDPPRCLPRCSRGDPRLGPTATARALGAAPRRQRGCGSPPSATRSLPPPTPPQRPPPGGAAEPCGEREGGPGDGGSGAGVGTAMPRGCRKVGSGPTPPGPARPGAGGRRGGERRGAAGAVRGADAGRGGRRVGQGRYRAEGLRVPAWGPLRVCVCLRGVPALVSRSQFALKFLDPSFVPITNSLTQELQEKPSKWAFNRTAFAHQR